MRASEQVADYEQLPYQLMPFDVTQLSHAAAIARLFGLDTPAVESARVLDPGCVSGDNLILPHRPFLGCARDAARPS